MEIRRFKPSERSELRSIRLAGLAECPLAFGSTLQHEQVQADAFWDRWLEGNPPFGAFEGPLAVGIAGFSRNTMENLKHRGNLGAMFVAAQHRGAGVAQRLVEAVIAHAADEGAEQVHLTVTAGNTAAERLYRRMGFTTYGVEPRGMKYLGQHHDLILMVRKLL